MHARFGETGKGFIGGVGVIRTGDDDRRGAIIEQVNFLCQGRIFFLQIGQQVSNCICNTVTFGLPGNDQSVHIFERFNKGLVMFA